VVEYLRVFRHVGFFVRSRGAGINAMDLPNWTTARRIAQAVNAFEKQQTGHLPHSVAVVLHEDTLVITLRGVLSPAEKALAKSPTGAVEVQEFHRQLFASVSDSLLQEIKRITGVNVLGATAEVETTSGTMVQVCLLARCVPADSWSESRPVDQS
jgi:uncharacterized protein YbcI